MYADANKVRQILLNLLSNARKFTHRGEISFNVRHHIQMIEAEDRVGRWILFEVQDTGIGMSEMEIARLFQPFVQADGSSTRKYGGIGLGLAISKHFAQMMGGHIVVKSVPDEGSTFAVYLPLIYETAPKGGLA